MLRLRLVLGLVVPALSLSLPACVDTDAAVFVDASLTQPAATVAGSGLGTSITGGTFSLTLHLGPRASGASQVTLGAFSILGADKKTTIVSPLEAATNQTFPVTVDVDSDVDVPFTFDTGKTLLPKEKLAELCVASEILVSAVIQDSLQDGATPAYSPTFHPSGCP